MRPALSLLLAALLGAPLAAGADEPALSLLALGDTGKPTSWPSDLPAAVPRRRGAGARGPALARRGARLPRRQLLSGGSLAAQAPRSAPRRTSPGPYCHFLLLTRKGRRAVRDVCDRAPEETHPVPIIAVTGNHDMGRGQGVRLQRERLPVFLGNWLMPEAARSYELGAGVSVIAFHSEPIVQGAPADALADALRDSLGPWRIVIAHHPVADPGAGWKSDYAERVLAAIAAAGKPVHVFLAGHQHSLQALRGPGAALHVVSGAGGADLRALSPTAGERLFAEVALRLRAHRREAGCARRHLPRAPRSAGPRRGADGALPRRARRERGDAAPAALTSLRQCPGGRWSRGSPSTRSPMMLRWTFEAPPAIAPASENM